MMERLLRDIYDAISSLRQRISYLETQDGVADLSDAMSFVQLTDTPDNYIGQAGKFVAVTVGEDGLEFVDAGGGGVWDPDLPPANPSTLDDEFDDESLDASWTERDVRNTVTVSESGGVLVLTCTGPTHGEGYHHEVFGVGKPAPTGSYQAVVRVRVTETLTDGCGIGMGLKFPTPTNYVYVHAFSNPINGTETSVYYKAFGLGGGEGWVAIYPEKNPWTYIRFRYDHPSTTFWIDSSLDGLNWDSSPGIDTSGVVEMPNEILVSIGGSTQNGDVGVCDFFRVRNTAGNANDPVFGDYSERLVLDASLVGYTPADGTDWSDPDPNNVQDALDALAARPIAVALTIKEADGTPNVINVDTIVVTNGTLTDDGGGQVTLDFGSAATDGNAIHDNEAGEIAALTEKTTPNNADMLIIEDSEAGNTKKMVKIGNLPTNFPSFSGAQVSRSDQPIVPVSTYIIPWNLVHFDTDNYWDAQEPTRLTAPFTGYYQINMLVDLQDAADTDGYMVATVLRTMANFAQFVDIVDSQMSYSGDSTGPTLQSTGVWRLEAGDYIELDVTHYNVSGNKLVACGLTMVFMGA